MDQIPSRLSIISTRVPQNGRRGLERVLGTPVNFSKYVFDRSTPSMRKVDNAEKKEEKKRKENNVIFSGH